MPIFWKSKTILAKMEASYGTDPVPTGAANAILCSDVTFAPMEGNDVPRNADRPFFGAVPSLPAELRCVLTFTVELVGSGSLGVAPAWGPLLRACSAAEVITAATRVEYTPITNNPESVCLYFDVDGTLTRMRGARGTAELGLSANGLPTAKLTMTGLFSVPTQATKPTPNYALFQPPDVGSTANTPTFTIGGTAFVMRDFKLNLGNDIQPRILIGQEYITVVDKAEEVSVTVEAVPVTTYSPVAVAQAGTPQAIVLAHSTTIGRRVRFDIPTAQQRRPGASQVNQGVVEWPLVFTPLPNAGNDQWKITLT